MREDILPRIGQLAYSNEATLRNTYEIATKLCAGKVEGAFVECGVAQGAQVAMMLMACQELGDKRPVYLFDSFEGIPLCGPRDDAQPGIGAPKHDVNLPESERLKTSGISVGSVQAVWKNLSDMKLPVNQCQFVRGWFQNTVPDWKAEDKIALLRLDGDLYESTKVCLEHLYPKLVVGGYIIIDDYGLPGCKAAVKEYFDGTTPAYNAVLDTCKVIWWRKED